jgi:hypothetical protein
MDTPQSMAASKIAKSKQVAKVLASGPLGWKEKDPELYQAWVEAQTAILMEKGCPTVKQRSDWRSKDPGLYETCLELFRLISEELYNGDIDVAKAFAGAAIEMLAPGTGWKWTDQELARAWIEEAELAKQSGDKQWGIKALKMAMSFARDARKAEMTAAEFGQRGGEKRAKRLSAKRRKDISSKAGKARWSTVSRKRRRDLARKMARARWRKERKP